jgi:hypothetical protein
MGLQMKAMPIVWRMRAKHNSYFQANPLSLRERVRVRAARILHRSALDVLHGGANMSLVKHQNGGREFGAGAEPIAA